MTELKSRLDALRPAAAEVILDGENVPLIIMALAALSLDQPALESACRALAIRLCDGRINIGAEAFDAFRRAIPGSWAVN